MRARCAWPAEPDAFAFYPDLAAARRHLAAEDAHECGLASAVLADQRMHLARPHVKIDAAQGRTPPKDFVMASSRASSAMAHPAGMEGGERNARRLFDQMRVLAAQNTASLR